MKRAPELRDLSGDHHQGLVLARAAKQAAAGDKGPSVSVTWAQVETRFATELEPHFQIEESLIAPGLRALGETRLADRLREEHEALRLLVQPGSGRTAGDLQRFGELLEQHIRFEERELFEVVETRMSPSALRAIAEACRTRRDTGAAR